MGKQAVLAGLLAILLAEPAAAQTGTLGRPTTVDLGRVNTFQGTPVTTRNVPIDVERFSVVPLAKPAKPGFLQLITSILPPIKQRKDVLMPQDVSQAPVVTKKGAKNPPRR